MKSSSSQLGQNGSEPERNQVDRVPFIQASFEEEKAAQEEERDTGRKVKTARKGRSLNRLRLHLARRFTIRRSLC